MTGFSTVAFGAKLLALRNAAKGAVDWTTSNAAHLLLVALAGVFVWGWLGHHQAGKYRRAYASSEVAREADGKLWKQAFETERGSLKLVMGAIEEQNRAVASLKTESDRRVAANHAAVQKLAERAKTAEALSARMKAAFAAGGGRVANDGECKSDTTVTDAAKGGAL